MSNVGTPGDNDKGYYAPQQQRVARHLSSRQLIGAWDTVWSEVHSQKYMITDQDKTVLADGARVFSSFSEALGYFREAMAWMRRDQFWREQISLKGAMSVRNKMVVAKDLVKETYQHDGKTLTKLQAEMREIDPEAFDRLYSASQSTGP